MSKTCLKLALGIALPMMLVVLGCSDIAGPASQVFDTSVQVSASIVSQDLAQLSVASVTSETSKGVFAIGWKQFVAPNVTDAETRGEAYAVVFSDSTTSAVHPVGIDIGTVTLTYTGGSAALTKRTSRGGQVLYETFSKGMRDSVNTGVNVPFVSNGTYTFAVSGSTAFSAASFTVNAPASLLDITNHASGDTVSKSADLNIAWNGGSATDSVLVRIVPHLSRALISQHDSACIMGGRGEKGGPKGHRHGTLTTGGPLQDMGPAFEQGVVVTVPNTGSYTLSAADLQTLLGGTSASSVMVGVSQVVKQNVLHDGNTVTVLLRNGDRMVLRVK
jgi:hypothetical protein